MFSLPTFKGTYQLVPPPGVGGFGFKKLRRGLKKGLKKAGRGVKKGVRKSVKVSTKGLKVVAKAGKFAMKAVAKLAAKPIIMIVNKLAGRRAKYVAFKRTGSTALTLADRKAGGQYALRKLRGAGPIGKLAVRILKFTGGVTAGDTLGSDVTRNLSGWRQDAAMCGMTGAEIAAAAMSIVAATTKLMKTLNKPGEAPANPEAAAKQTQPTEETQPVIESAEDSPEASTEAPAEEAAAEETEEGDSTEGEELSLDQQIEIAQMKGNRALLKKLAAKWRRQHGAKWGQ